MCTKFYSDSFLNTSIPIFGKSANFSIFLFIYNMFNRRVADFYNTILIGAREKYILEVIR